MAQEGIIYLMRSLVVVSNTKFKCQLLQFLWPLKFGSKCMSVSTDSHVEMSNLKELMSVFTAYL